MDSVPSIRMELAPEGRIYPTADWIEKQQPKISSVAVIVAPFENQKSVLLTRRVSYHGVHGGQMSFPGGRVEPNETLLQACIRETQEEVGLSLLHQQPLIQLEPLYIPPSNFLVHPFVFELTHLPNLQTNHEVEYIRWIPWSDLVAAPLQFQSIAGNRSVPGFLFEPDFVWGATGMLLNEIRKTLFLD